MSATIFQDTDQGSVVPHAATRVIETESKTQPKPIWGNALSSMVAPLVLRLADSDIQVPIPLNERVILGRKSMDTATLVNLDFTLYQGVEKGVSRVHATLYRVKHIVHIMDMNSANGTFLNGRRLAPYQERILRDGDEVCLGGLRFTVHF
jgi:hypothetical protein